MVDGSSLLKTVYYQTTQETQLHNGDWRPRIVMDVSRFSGEDTKELG